MDETEPNNQTETRQLTGFDTPLAGPQGERCRARHPMIVSVPVVPRVPPLRCSVLTAFAHAAGVGTGA